MNRKKKQRFILVATAHAELFGTSTSVRSIARVYGEVWPSFPKNWDSLSPKERKEHYVVVGRAEMRWVRQHEKLRKKGLIEKPDDAPSKLTEEGWKIIEELLRNGGTRFPHRRSSWPYKNQRRAA